MPYIPYKLMHFLGIFTTLIVLTVIAVHVLRGGTRKDLAHRRGLGIAHGVASLLILTGGFGMLARLGVMHDGLPGWVYAKVVIWLALSAAIAVPYLGPAYARALLIAAPVLAVAGAAIALYKPF